MAEPSAARSLVTSDVRRHNLALICRALAQGGPLSRSRLAERTGITPGSLTSLSSELIAAGVVREVVEDTRRPAGRGRPSTPLALAADHLALLAVQLDADAVSAVYTTVAGDWLGRIDRRHGRPIGDSAAVLDVMARVVDEALAACRRLGREVADATVVVFAPAGQVPGTIIADTDLGWGPTDVLGELCHRVPALAPIATLVSDSPVGLHAELQPAGMPRNALYLKSNSGIGGAAVCDGELVRGAHGVAAAFGHIAVDYDGRPCACGQRGCLDTVAGPDVVLAQAGLTPTLADEGLTAALTALVERVRAGEEAAVTAWQDAVTWIVRALRILTVAFDPDVVILGGYWADLADSIEAAWIEAFPAGTPAGDLGAPRIVPGHVGPDAALLGAIELARDRLLDDPAALAAAARRDVS